MRVLLRVAAAAAALFLSFAPAAAQWKPGAAGGSNPRMTALFQADQGARTSGAKIDWTVVAREDEQRRRETRALLDKGELSSATDFYHAAFIFQHSGEPGDYLLAHTLAIVAVARGRADATWIAAASLDRYLMSVGQKQIYGTQYRKRDGQPTTQEPYHRGLVPDALRKALGVPAQAEQDKRRAEIESHHAPRPSSPAK
jgi:hypothetical protein